MKWLSGIWDVVIGLSLKAKTIFVFSVLLLVAGYFFMDRVLTFKKNIAMIEATSKPQYEKRNYEKRNDVPHYINRWEDYANYLPKETAKEIK